MPVTIGKHKFKFVPHGVLSTKCWVANDGRLIVRRSVVDPKMWCADYRVGSDSTATLKGVNGKSRRFKRKDTAMKAIVQFWDAL